MVENTAKRDKFNMLFTFFMVHSFSSLQLFHLPLFLESEGMSKSQIGYLVFIGTVFAVIGQFIWASVADKASSVNRILFIVSAGAILTLPIYLISTGFIGLAVSIGCYNFFISSTYPLIDSMCLYYGVGRKSGIQYGHARLMGSIGFLVLVIIGSITIGYYAGSIFVLQAIAGLILLVAIRLSPRVIMPKMKKVAFNPIPVIKKPSVMAILILGFFVFLATGIQNAFYTPYFVNEMGAPSYMLSFAFIISISVEVVFLFNMNKLMKKINIKTLFFLAALMMTIRWIVYGLSTHYIFLMIFNIFDGIVLVSVTGYTGIYFKAISPPEGKVSMQSIKYLINYGFAKGIGGLAGAPLMAAVGGMKNTYLTMGIVMAIVSVAFILAPVKFLDLRDYIDDNDSGDDSDVQTDTQEILETAEQKS